MLEDLKNKPIEKLHGCLKNAKKSDQTARKLTDEELNDVSGGYYEDSGYTAGFYISCPLCGRTKKKDIESWVENDFYGIDGFRCKCGAIWGMDSEGGIWRISDDLEFIGY